MNLAVTLPIPHLAYSGTDVRKLGGSDDDIKWDDGSPILWDNLTNVLWDSAAGVASSDIFSAFSYPKTQYTGSV